MADNEDVSVRASIEAAFAESSDTTQGAEIPAKAVEPPAAATPAAADKPVAPNDAAKPADKDATAKPKRIEPPVRWAKEDKEAWDEADKLVDGLTPEAAAAVKKIQSILVGRNKSMEGEFTRNMQSVAADRAYKADIDKVISPRRQQWANSGMSDAQAVAQLFDGVEHSMRDPSGFATWILQQRGVNPLQYAAQLVSQAGYSVVRKGQEPQRGGAGEDDVQLHPAVQRVLDEVRQENQQLRQQLGGVQQSVGQFTTAAQAQQAREQQAVAATVTNDLRAFETATDEAGALKHPFLGDVRADMGKLIDAGLAEDLADAYDKAIYARPDLRAKMLENDRLRTVREYEARMADEAKRSRGASGGLSGTGSSARAAPETNDAEPGSVREALMQSMQQLSQRARV